MPTWTNPVWGLMREGGTTVAAVDWVDLQRQDPENPKRWVRWIGCRNMMEYAEYSCGDLVNICACHQFKIDVTVSKDVSTIFHDTFRILLQV